ncbi:uncharacterized protein [Cicer arietinum]|uniref:Uncharacterized protein LOC101513510 n=1 Tax=Cicer arietinum TaxID=3827 RepID=A0A3Q7YGB3_CICAR|nr:uncharacterized protein LOC101513510 [Cicer arietinum]
MYATRLFSLYKLNPSALSDPPPSGPNSSYLVLFDEEAETCSCFGFCKTEYNIIKDFPFPQNKNLTIHYSYGDNSNLEKVMFLPVLNQPLSSNRYYVIGRKGENQGKASTSSKEEDMATCSCFSVDDVKPRPLEPFNDYQQVEIIKKDYGFCAKSLATDGTPAGLLKERGWTLEATTPQNYQLSQALGSNDSLRSKQPNFNFPCSNDCSESMVVGKWYCPFMFVKEGMNLKEQMNMSVFYELTLEQRWEKIFSKENENSEEGVVFVDVVVQTEVAKVRGKDAVWDENRLVDGVLWFKKFVDVEKDASVGLSVEVVEGMKWEQKRVGWIGGNGRQAVRVTKVEEFGGTNKWKKFSCYVLIESFVLRSMDRRLVLTCDYKHSHQIRSKWE